LAAPNTLIIASEHSFGCLLEFNLDKQYTARDLTDNLIPINTIE
jgi:hypothetical protein